MFPNAAQKGSHFKVFGSVVKEMTQKTWRLCVGKHEPFAKRQNFHKVLQFQFQIVCSEAAWEMCIGEGMCSSSLIFCGHCSPTSFRS